jgi:protein-disulfide isomerase
MSVRISTLVCAGIAALVSTACSKPNDAVVQKLDEISQKLDKLDAIEKKLGGVGAAGVAQRPRPSGPMPGTPAPDKTYAMPIDGDPFAGPKSAKVTIVKGFEFACPFCERVRPTLEQLEKDYGKDIKVVYKNYVVHPQVATIPAHASCAAARQGKYVEMMNLIWEKGFKANRNLGADNMVQLARELGLDVKKFEADMNGEDCAKKVEADQAQLAALGTRGTPAFYINGRFLSGAQPIDRFKQIIDEELKKANERIAKGEATVDNYYAKFVMEKGEKQL